MSPRCARVLLVALVLAFAGGCFRSKAAPKAVPSAPASTVAPEPTPPPPVEPDPVPGEGVRLHVPADGGVWPWQVGRAEEPGEFRPVSLLGAPPFSLSGLAVRPDANRAVVSFKSEKKGQPVSTRFIYCDTATGKVITEWQVAGLQAALDLSPDGRSILSTSSQPGRDRTVLRLWLVGSDGQLRRQAWTPHIARHDGIRLDPGVRAEAGDALEIRWAAFVGDRIASSSRLGQLRIFDAEGGKPLYTLEGSPGRPALTPDGSKIALFTGNAVTLVDPAVGTVVGTRWIGPLPPQPVLAFSPDGTRLAVGGNGKALLVNLASGDVQQSLLPRLHVNDTGTYDKPFGWAGRYLFADGRLLDPQQSAPVWEYTGVEQLQLQGWRQWACSRTTGSTTAILSCYNLPHTQAMMHIAAESDRTASNVFGSGEAVRIDVSGVPEDHRNDALSALEQRVRLCGYRPDPAAPAVLFASVDTAGIKAATAYSGLDTFAYTKKPAQLRLVVNGKELWSESWAVEPPYKIRTVPNATLAEHFKEPAFGGPNYALFATASIPPFIPNPQAPGAPIGTTELIPDRVKGWLAW